MMATPVQTATEPEYGAKVEQANNEADLAAAQPAPAVAMPPLMAEGDEPPAAAQQEYFTVKNPYMLLPHTVNFPQEKKTPVEQRYDAGQVFAMMADSSPVFRMVSKELLGG